MANVDLFKCKLNLASHEKGGHTIRKHIMTPDELLLNQSNSTEFLSAYISKEIAEFWTQAAVDFNKKYIVAWYQIAPAFQNNAIYYTSEDSVGFGAWPGDKKTTPLYTVKVVLEKMPKDQDKDILILSSYPVLKKPEFIVKKNRQGSARVNSNWRIRDGDSVTAPFAASDAIPGNWRIPQVSAKPLRPPWDHRTVARWQPHFCA